MKAVDLNKTHDVQFSRSIPGFFFSLSLCAGVDTLGRSDVVHGMAWVLVEPSLSPAHTNHDFNRQRTW